jgi:SanA protein
MGKSFSNWSKALIVINMSILGLAFYIDQHIQSDFDSKIFSELKSVPSSDVGLVLGTAKWVGDRQNLFYLARVETAARLFKSGKIKAILISGDNSRKGYDEPTDMKTDLVKLGIPEKCITLDYAGFRTLDSIVRARDIFGISSYTIISQKSHVRRVLYLAEQYSQICIGFEAWGPGGGWRTKQRIREFFARFKAFLDVYILKTEPKFYGKKETITIVSS